MSALTLRLLASICMLLDHIGYCLHVEILRYIGRLAFPIYVFLMVNGFYHTRDRRRYAGRMALFAILSQIPFALMCNQQIFYPKLNVMVTLLLGFCTIWAGETLTRHCRSRYLNLLPGIALWVLCYTGIIRSDYGAKGILMTLVFWHFRNKPLWMTVGAFLAVFHETLLHGIAALLRGTVPALPTSWEVAQIFSLLTLPLLFLYNQKPGPHFSTPAMEKNVRLSFYAFYPLHMLALWFLFLR